MFSCKTGAKYVSVCSGPHSFNYRFGALEKPEIEVRSTGDDGKVFQSGAVGGGHGSEQSIRFVQGEYSYIVSSGEAGDLTDAPGKQWSVLTVERGHTVIASHKCENVSPQENMTSSDLSDDPDPEFVAWY
jgi:hypothetical protein